MSGFPMIDVTVFQDEHDFSCDTNSLSLDGTAATPESTTFCSGGYIERVAGLKDLTLTLSGYWQAGADSVDDQAWAGLTTAPTVTTVTPTGADADTAFIFQPVESSYSLGGEVGDVTPFSLTNMNRTAPGLISGILDLPKQTITGDTDGTGTQLGALTSTQTLYLSLHCFTAGTTADVIVESDDNSGFTSPTTRITETITATGGTFSSVAGAVTDDYWRITVSSVTGSFSLAGAIAIA